MTLTAASATGTFVQDEPQRRQNATLEQTDSTNALLTRNIFSPLIRRTPTSYTCETGYSACAYDTSLCCPNGYSCCPNGYCVVPGGQCCTTGTCPSNWECCEGGNTCSPIGGECCNDGYYCLPGKRCRTWQGKRVCCPSSGCAGEVDNGDLGSTLLATTPTISATAGSTHLRGR
jgi:hypothetical protein